MISFQNSGWKTKNLLLSFLLALAGCAPIPHAVVFAGNTYSFKERQYTETNATGLTNFGTSASRDDWKKVDPLREIVYPQAVGQKSGPGWQRILIALILCGLGLLQMINPRLAWKMEQGWKYKNLEPGDSYLVVSRVAGAGLILIGLWILLLRG